MRCICAARCRGNLLSLPVNLSPLLPSQSSVTVSPLSLRTVPITQLLSVSRFSICLSTSATGIKSTGLICLLPFGHISAPKLAGRLWDLRNPLPF